MGRGDETTIMYVPTYFFETMVRLTELAAMTVTKSLEHTEFDNSIVVMEYWQ